MSATRTDMVAERFGVLLALFVNNTVKTAYFSRNHLAHRGRDIRMRRGYGIPVLREFAESRDCKHG